jgi:hypothetical protein
MGLYAPLNPLFKRPDIVLHTSAGKGDIRGYVKWRKINGGAHSDLGKRCRDGFVGLKKACGKLGLTFWDYRCDRIGQFGEIAPLLRFHSRTRHDLFKSSRLPSDRRRIIPSAPLGSRALKPYRNPWCKIPKRLT